MSVLVTGGSGMIASRIVRDLVRKGENVVVNDLVIDEEVLNYVLTESDRKNITFVQGDILDYDALMETCKKNNVDKIIHTASMMGNAKEPRLATQINTGGMMNILEIARELKVKKVVYTSTNSVFHNQIKELIPNDEKFDPDTVYGCTKAFNEYAAELYYKLYGMDITGIRVGALIFGPLQRRGVSGSIAIETLQKPAIGEVGNCPYNDYGGWLYVDEVARVHVMAMDVKRKPGMAGSYNLGGTIVSFKEMAEFTKSLIPDAVINFENKELSQYYWNVDMSLLEKEIGYKPEWDVFDAFKFTINETRRVKGLDPVE